MALDADIYDRKEALAPGLALSTMLHVALIAAVVLLPGVFNHGGSDWGNGGSGAAEGGAISAHLVSGIPLPPKPNANPEQVLATENPGLSVTQPAPAAKPEENAIPIPDRESKRKPAQKEAPVSGKALPREQAALSHPLPHPPKEVSQADNSIPYGEGGPVTGPFTSFQSGNTNGGLKFGEGGSGSFGSRFGWYTDVVARKVHEAWQSEVNPSVSSARRVYITFDISRSGAPSHVRVEQSSGVPSLDISALRALQRIDTFGPLPSGYSGNYVSVEFWFDYRR